MRYQLAGRCDMKVFFCTACEAGLVFGDRRCEHCGELVGTPQSLQAADMPVPTRLARVGAFFESQAATKSSAKTASQMRSPRRGKPNGARAAVSQKSPAKLSGDGVIVTSAPIQGWCPALESLAVPEVLSALPTAFMMFSLSLVTSCDLLWVSNTVESCFSGSFQASSPYKT
jgi:hypothetical protein